MCRRSNRTAGEALRFTVRTTADAFCSIVNIAATAAPLPCTAMELQRIKMIVCASWVTVTLAITIALPLTWPLQLGFAALGLLPPLALLLWWNDPGQTMTEAIDEVRRGR